MRTRAISILLILLALLVLPLAAPHAAAASPSGSFIGEMSGSEVILYVSVAIVLILFVVGIVLLFRKYML